MKHEIRSCHFLAFQYENGIRAPTNEHVCEIGYTHTLNRYIFIWTHYTWAGTSIYVHIPYIQVQHDCPLTHSILLVFAIHVVVVFAAFRSTVWFGVCVWVIREFHPSARFFFAFGDSCFCSSFILCGYVLCVKCVRSLVARPFRWLVINEFKSPPPPRIVCCVHMKEEREERRRRGWWGGELHACNKMYICFRDVWCPLNSGLGVCVYVCCAARDPWSGEKVVARCAEWICADRVFIHRFFYWWTLCAHVYVRVFLVVVGMVCVAVECACEPQILCCRIAQWKNDLYKSLNIFVLISVFYDNLKKK